LSSSIASGIRVELMRSMIVAAGEVGYRSVPLARVCGRCGATRARFYAHFAGKEECFAAACAEEGERLCERLLAQPEAGGSREAGLEAALAELAEYLIAEEPLARGLLVEARSAGRATLEGRLAALDRLADALARGFRAPDPDVPPPTAAARFMVGAVEHAAATAVAEARPQRFAAAVPELTRMVAAAF
jgi:AcrR family transcriptional regulator